MSFLFVACLVLAASQKFYDHPLYFLPLLVPGVLLAAFSIGAFFERLPSGAKPPIKILLILFVLITNIFLFWKPAFEIPRDAEDLFEATSFIQDNTPEGSRLIAIHGTSADFLYYSRRRGVGFVLGANREELPKYFKSSKFSRLSVDEIEERNAAYGDSIRWLEYLKGKQKINYVAVVPSRDLQQEKELHQHLDRKYELISPPDKNFLIYKISD